jgi:hypothetical protein
VLTGAVERVTAILLLRLRYTFDEAGEAGFAEEVRLAAVERRGGQLVVLEPASSALDLVGRATPAGNLGPALKTEHVEDMLRLLAEAKGWWQPLADARRAELEAAHRRLRRLTGGGGFKARLHPPPDVMACFVLVPAMGKAP